MDRRTNLYTEGGWVVIRKGELISMEEARPCRTTSTSPAQHINIDKSHNNISFLLMIPSFLPQFSIIFASSVVGTSLPESTSQLFSGRSRSLSAGKHQNINYLSSTARIPVRRWTLEGVGLVGGLQGRSQDFISGVEHFSGSASWGARGRCPRTPENLKEFS